jgi:hypothetical protein
LRSAVEVVARQERPNERTIYSSLWRFDSATATSSTLGDESTAAICPLSAILPQPMIPNRTAVIDEIL